MNRTLFVLASGIALAIGLGLTTTQDAHDTPQDAMALAMPGPVHQDIMLRAGTFKTETRMTMAPGAEATVTHGRATMKSILDGRFLIEDSSGEMMGMQFKGHRMWGFNNATGQFESVWTYTLSTGMMYVTGTPQEDGTVVGTANWTEAHGAMRTKVIFHSPDPDHIWFKMMSLPEMGEEFVMYEEHWTRE